MASDDFVPPSKWIETINHWRDKAEQLDQQLSQSREEIERLRANPIPDHYKAQYALILGERDAYREENAAMRAVLERITKQSPWHMSNDEPPVPICHWCHVRVDLFHTRADQWEHGEGCLILKIRAVLQKGQKDGE